MGRFQVYKRRYNVLRTFKELMDTIDLNLDDLNGLETKTTKTFIFLPVTGKDMKGEYPELRDVEEFMTLMDVELRFVWMIANKTSPFNCSNELTEISKFTKYEQAMKHSGLAKKVSEKTRTEYLQGRFTQKIHDAIQKMQVFNPSLRMRAKIMTETMFNNLEKMIEVTEEELEKMTVTDKKDYASLCKIVTDSKDVLLPQVENAYGVKEMKKKGISGTKEPTFMDIALNSGN